MKKTIEYKHGKISFLDTDFYIGKALEAYGEREELEVQFLCSLVNSGDVFVDVGANIGAITIPVAKKVGQSPDGKVIAFEPQGPMYELLCENVEQNELKVETYKAGLGAEAGRAGLPKVDYNQPNNFGGCALLPGDEVEVITLDSLELGRCNFIKIDVEGKETEVIRGAVKTILRHRPLLYVENDRYQQSVELITLLQSLDYELFWCTPKLFNPDNWKGATHDLFPGTISVNMICVPTDMSPDYKVRHITPIVKDLRRVSSPYDRETGRATLPTDVRLPNGWAAVVRFGGIGDNLQAASAVGALKRKGYKVEMITSTDCCWQVFQHNPNIDKLTVKTKSEIPQLGSVPWQTWHKGRSEEYDVFANLHHSAESTLCFFPQMTQFYWPAHVRRALANKNYLEFIHDIAGCGYDFGPLYYASDFERTHAIETKAKVGERCIALCMSGSRNDKLHPRLPGIVSRLLSELDAPVVMLGDSRNYQDAIAIQKFVHDTNGTTTGLHVAISNVDGNYNQIDWPLRRSLAFVQQCDLVIGPDTGIMWAVAFEQMPKISLLGHASPENITKHWLNTVTLTANSGRVPCYPCHQLHGDEAGVKNGIPLTCTPNADNSGAACISDISVETIIQEAKELWAGQGTFGVKQNLELTPYGVKANERSIRSGNQVRC